MPGVNLHTISIRPGYDTIKAVKEGRVFEINEKIISSPTFRYSLGVFEMARYLYPKIMDKLDIYNTKLIADIKEILANILVRFSHQPVYIPSSSKYYQLLSMRAIPTGLFPRILPGRILILIISKQL